MSIDINKIKSPLFYMGNKYDLLDNLLMYFPKKEEVNQFIDLFGGSGVVTANVPYKNVLYNELNENIVGLFSLIKNTNPKEIIDRINYNVDKYNLEKENKNQYLKFRKFYNESDRNPIDLLTLTYYSFCNMIRFNNKNEFNMPTGNCKFLQKNHDIQIKLFNDILNKKNVIIENKDAFDILEEIKSNDNQFIYLDPPYTNTMAIYNEQRAGGGWNIEDDIKLFKELDRLNELGIKWAMSNVLENKGIKNEHIEVWAKNNNYKIIEFMEKEYYALGKGNAMTREVLIINYEPPFEQFNIFDFL